MGLSAGTSIQVGAVFILFICSFCGVSIPLALINDKTKQYLPFLNALAAGIMLGLALVSLFV